MKHAAIACGTLLWLLSGCDSVTVKEPIGSPPPIAELKALQGGWVNEEGATFEVRLSKSGNLLLGGVEWDEDNEEFRAETIEVVATKCRDLKLLHDKSGDEAPDDGYLFCRYEIQDANMVRLYFPVVSVFEQAVASGELPGTIKRHPRPDDSVNVRLDATAEQVDAFLEKSGDAACFENEPLVTFKRLRQVE